MGALFIPNTLAVIKGGPNTPRAQELVDYLLQAKIEEQLARADGAQFPLNDQASETSPAAPEEPYVAVYPTQYASHVKRLMGKPIRMATSSETYVVRRGDTLWEIARRHDTTVRQLLELNDRNSATIRIGETLRIPSGG
jgi:nucleoid-associated protein YgaU